ncbi:hypothetical protein OROMI_015952 [Orobanche minor]
MGCFLGCFGDAKDPSRRKQRVERGGPQIQRNRVQNVQQENPVSAGLSTNETITNDLVPELRPIPDIMEQTSPSPKKKVTFNSNVTAYEHVPSIRDSIDSLHERTTDVEKEEQKDSKASYSISEEDSSIISSVASYPPNHRYYNARDSDDADDDEAEEYGDGDSDDDLDGEDDYDEYDEDIIDTKISSHEIWSEPVLTESVESRTGNSSRGAMNEEVGSPIFPDEEIKTFGSKTNARDRSDYINSVLNPVENITQWKAAKSKGTHVLKPQKENLTTAASSNPPPPPRISFSSEPTFKKKQDQSKSANQEIAVDASLSNWLALPEITPSKKTSFGGFETNTSGETVSKGCTTSVRSFVDRPILGALTVEELRQVSASNSPRKSPSRSPDEMPIIGTVGAYWSHSSSKNRSDSADSSFKGIPNTNSKYREDKRVNWHSTPFETRLDRALNQGAS